MNSEKLITQLVHVFNIIRPSHKGIYYVSPEAEAFYFQELGKSFFGLLVPKWQMLELVPQSVHRNDDAKLEEFVRKQPNGNLFFALMRKGDANKFVAALLDGTTYKTGDDAFASYKGGDADLLRRRKDMIIKAHDQAVNGERQAIVTDRDIKVVIQAAIQRLDAGRRLLNLKEIGLPKQQIRFRFNRDPVATVKNLNELFDVVYYLEDGDPSGSNLIFPVYKLNKDDELFPVDVTKGVVVVDGVRVLAKGKLLIPYLKERKVAVDASATVSEAKKAEMKKLLEQAEALPNQKLYTKSVQDEMTQKYKKVLTDNGGAYPGDKVMEDALRSIFNAHLDQAGGGAVFGDSETSEPVSLNLDDDGEEGPDMDDGDENEDATGLFGGAKNENLSEEFFKEIMADEKPSRKNVEQKKEIPFEALYGGAMEEYDNEMSLSDVHTAQKTSDSKRRKFIFRKD